MKKQILLILMILLPMVASADDSGKCGDNVNYTYVEATHTLTISGSGEMYNFKYNSGSPTTPWNNYSEDILTVFILDGVTSIGHYAFYGCSRLASVTIGNGVMNIGNYAFSGCRGLTSVMIPNSVTSIGEDAFRGCSSLTSVHISDISAWCNISFGNYDSNPLSYAHHLYLGEEEIKDLVIPSNVSSIGSYAFDGCSSLISITIPNSVTSIGEMAFSNCSGLTSVTIGNSVTILKRGTFYHCSSLTTVMIPNSVSGIEIGNNYPSHYGVFEGCSGLTSVTIGEGVTNIGNYAFYGCSRLASVTIGNGVMNIGNYAFSGCRGLTSVMIPNSVTSIGEDAFRGCSSLTSVTIPGCVTSIGSYAFDGCNKISSVSISDLYAWCNLFNTNRSSPIISSNHHLLLNGVDLQRLTIPDSITNIGNYTFYGCSNITSISIPNSVMTIGERAFQNCSKVEELKLPDNLQIIKKATFYGCNSLKVLTIPSTVEVIYQWAFAGNTKMESVKALPETPPFLYDNSFSKYNIPLYAPESAIEVYKTTSPWSNFGQFLTLDGTEVEVPQCATPTVAYQDGQLMLDCETEGAEFVWTLRNPDTLSGRGKTIELARQYELTVYATAEGYTDSAFITYYIVWGNKEMEGDNVIHIGGATADVNGDGAVNIADITAIISKMAGK